MVGPVIGGSDASQPPESQTEKQKLQAFAIEFETAVLGSYGAATKQHSPNQLPGSKASSMGDSEGVTEKNSLNNAAHRVINLFEQLSTEGSLTDKATQHVKGEAQSFINGNDPTAFNHLITTANSYLPSNAQLPKYT